MPARMNAFRRRAPLMGLCGAALVAGLLVARSSLAPFPVIVAMLATFQLAAVLVARCLPRRRPALVLFEAVVTDLSPGAAGPARARVVRVAASSEAAARALLRPLGVGAADRLWAVAGPARRAGVLRLGRWLPVGEAA